MVYGFVGWHRGVFGFWRYEGEFSPKDRVQMTLDVEGVEANRFALRRLYATHSSDEMVICRSEAAVERLIDLCKEIVDEESIKKVG